jgi:hypothetical protein
MTTKTEVAEGDAKKPVPKLLQLLPCEPGWHVVAVDGEGLLYLRKIRVAAWALLDTGEVVPMIPVEDDDGDAVGLATAADAMRGDRYRLYSPAESYEYALTSEVADGLAMAIPDDANEAEAIAVSECNRDGDVTRTVLWRYL